MPRASAPPSTTTENPALAKAIAAERPAAPVPITRTSASDGTSCTWLKISTLVDGYIIAERRARVKLAWTADFLARVLDHFLPLRDPAGGARDGEEHGEHGGRETHRFQGDA